VLPVDREGRVDPAAVRRALRPKTRLISVMAANNETGVLQPVEELGRIAAEADVWFHTDAVQAVGRVPLDVNQMKCDLLTLSAHKMNGPQGVGALYVRGGTPLRSLLLGGGQERGHRAGTENLAGIVGLGAACQVAQAWLARRGDVELAALRDRLERGILDGISGTQVNGRGAPRVPNTSNIAFDRVPGRGLVVALDRLGVYASTGAACASATNEPPHVLLAMGLPPELAHASVRFSLGKQTTAREIDLALELVPRAVAAIRADSPLWAEPAVG
jgi:cysteine desulfurase